MTISIKMKVLSDQKIDFRKRTKRASPKAIVLRPLSYADKEMLFKWRNMPFLIPDSASGRMVSWEEHCRWFDKVTHQKLTKIFIIQQRNQPIGQLRFEHIKNNQYQISIYLLEKYTGQGLGPVSLKNGMDVMIKNGGQVEFMAVVKKGNHPSYSLFKRAGFQETNDDQNIPQNYIMFRYVQDQHDVDHNAGMTSLIEFYDRQVKQHGDSIYSLAWGSKASQEKRFEILSQIGDLHHKKILDVGCGLGDYYSWLAKKGIEVDYLGIDITASMIQQAKKKYPKAKFKTANILEMQEAQPNYDYIFASGIFNRKVKNHERFVEGTIQKMFQFCRQGIAFNILSQKADFKEKDEYYADSDQLLKFCRTLSQNVALNHDYMPHDFTVFVHKR